MLATRRDQWIHEICRRFTEATGWRLTFVPPGSDASGARERLPIGRADLWSIQLGGAPPRGVLSIGLPTDASRCADFAAVRQLAELLGEVLNRLFVTETERDSCARSMATLIDREPAPPAGGNGPEAAPHGQNGSGLAQSVTRLLNAAVDVTHFRSAAFFLLDSSSNRLKLRGLSEREPVGLPNRQRHLTESLADLRALVRGRAIIRRAQGGARWLPEESSIGLCLAVRSESGPLGTLWVFDRRGRLPEEYEISLLETVCAQLGQRLERAVLLRENASGQRMQRDLHVASRNHSSAPTIGDRLPSALDVAAVCTSRYELGGDLCELMPLDNKRVAVAVGDASGDSVPAAMIMSAVRGALRTLCSERSGADEQTSSLVERINQVLIEITPPHQFMSLVYAVLDAGQRRLVYTNAGHPVPILVRNGQAQRLASHGLLLGVSDAAEYESSELPLAVGDLLILYSDGVSEATDGRRELFGAQGVIEAVRPVVEEPAEVVLQSILSRLDQHTHGSRDADDRTLLVIRIRE